MASSSQNLASGGGSPQLAILKRGKRQVATQIKMDYSSGRSAGLRQLEEILAYLLDCEKAVDFEATDWCRHLISGGVGFQEFSENGQSANKLCSALLCSHVAYFINFSWIDEKTLRYSKSIYTSSHKS